jgi:hypothetical protein
MTCENVPSKVASLAENRLSVREWCCLRDGLNGVRIVTRTRASSRAAIRPAADDDDAVEGLSRHAGADQTSASPFAVGHMGIKPNLET